MDFLMEHRWFLLAWAGGVALILAVFRLVAWLRAPRCDAFGCRRRATFVGFKAPSWDRPLRWCEKHADLPSVKP